MRVEEKSIGIFVYKDVLDGKNFIAELEIECSKDNQTFWNKSLIGDNGGISEYRSSQSCNLCWIMNPNQSHRLYKMFREDIYLPLQECFIDYSTYFGSPTGFHEMMDVLKYENGGQYRTHIDHGPGMPRLFSLVSILENTSTGGVLSFPYHKVEIEAIPGSVILFPAGLTYDHNAGPVSDGIKYSLVTWFP